MRRFILFVLGVLIVVFAIAFFLLYRPEEEVAKEEDDEGIFVTALAGFSPEAGALTAENNSLSVSIPWTLGESYLYVPRISALTDSLLWYTPSEDQEGIVEESFVLDDSSLLVNELNGTVFDVGLQRNAALQFFVTPAALDFTPVPTRWFPFPALTAVPTEVFVYPTRTVPDSPFFDPSISGFVIEPVARSCSFDVSMSERVITENEDVILTVMVTNETASECAKEMLVEAPSLDPSSDHWQMSVVSGTSSEFQRILVPKKRGTFHILVHDKERYQILGIVVTDAFGFSATQVALISFIGVVLGSAITVPYWIDLWLKRKERRNTPEENHSSSA